MGQTAASKVEITTAQFSTTFQSRYSADSLGVFSMVEAVMMLFLILTRQLES